MNIKKNVTVTIRPSNILRLLALCLFILPTPVPAVDDIGKRALPLHEFLALAAKNDTVFESILIDRLPLQYRRDVLLPASDVILAIKQQYNFYLDQDRSNPETSLSLSKLFPMSGTDVSLSYTKSSSALTTVDSSELEFLISQPIAKNAFGKGTQLLDQIIGVENDVTRYQIVEAYEDYLASLSAAYYNWYSAYENLKVGQASYQSNLKLLDNIHDRQRQNIALPIDVNKMQLLVIGKQENIIVLQEIFDNFTNLIAKAIRHDGKRRLIPVKPARPAADVKFGIDYETFTQTSRTYRTLRLLEQQSTLEVKKAADDLLPSTNLLLGYKLEGQDVGIRNDESIAFAGISVRWPIGRTVEKAKHKLAQIERQKTQLSNQNKYEDLRTNLKNLYQQIEREKKLIDVAQKKITLAEAVLKDEAENYSFGKVTLNDYIDAVNRVDENRFNNTEHTVQLHKLLLEWLRLTDKLVDEKVLERDIN